MPFRVFEIADQGACFVISIICALCCVTAIVLRFVATHRSNRKAAVEDWLALAAVLVFLARIGFVLNCLIILNGRTLDLTLGEQSFEKVMKMIFPATIFAMLDQTFAKLSICAIYRRTFGVNQVYRRWIYFLAAAQCATWFTLLCIQFLQCQPLHKYWNWLAPGRCMPWTNILLATEPPNSLVDLGLVALAMAMIRPLQLKSSAKWKLRFLFGLGSLAGIFGFIKIGLAYNPDPIYLTASLLIWSTIQSLICIVCCCAPVYRPLFPGGLWSRATSKISTYSPRLKSKRGKGSLNSQTRSWKTASLDPYFQGEGRFSTGYYTGSTRCLVTSDAGRGVPHIDKNHPMGSIQVDRRVDVDYPTTCQTSDEDAPYFPGNLQPSGHSMPHFHTIRVPPEAFRGKHTGQAV